MSRGRGHDPEIEAAAARASLDRRTAPLDRQEDAHTISGPGGAERLTRLRDPGTLAALQRLVGNRAVAQIPTVQRGKGKGGQGGGRFTGHAVDRGAERGISNTKMREIIRPGNRGVVKYDDSSYDGATIYWESATGWTVVVASNGQVITTYNQPVPKARWTPR